MFLNILLDAWRWCDIYFNLTWQLQIDYKTLNEMLAAPGEDVFSPLHLSQNGTVLVWAVMRRGFALLLDWCSCLARHTETNLDRHLHTKQELNNCLMTHLCKQKKVIILPLQRQTFEEKSDISRLYLLLLFPLFYYYTREIKQIFLLITASVH